MAQFASPVPLPHRVTVEKDGSPTFAVVNWQPMDNGLFTQPGTHLVLDLIPESGKEVVCTVRVEPRGEAIKVAAIVDSITAGFRTTDETTQSYPAQLAKLLRAVFEVMNFDVNTHTVLAKWSTPRSSSQWAPRIL